MKKQFVTYEIAKQLKELGFDEECIKWFNVKEELVENSIFSKNGNICYPKNSDFKCDGMITAPLWQQVIDWFREKYKLYINIEPDITKNWQFSISNLNDGLLFGSKSLFIQKGLNYEEIREQVILKVIELCQNKK